MRQLFAMGLLALLVPVARAESIAEETFLATLGEEHPATRALAEGLGLAEADRVRAGTMANPRVAFWREEPDDQPRVTNWTVAWVAPFDGRYRLGKEAADKGLAAARERFGLDRALLRREAREAFAEWSLGYERLDALRRRLELVERLAEQQRERARVGEESGLAARRFALATAEVRGILREAEAAYAASEAVVRAWRPDLSTSTTPVPLALPAIPALPAEIEPPEVRALTLEAERASLDVQRTGRFWGFPTLEIGAQTIEDGGVAHTGPIFAVSWSVPLLDRDKAARLEAERREAVVGARLDWTRARITGEIRGRAKAYEVLLGSAQEAREAARETDRVIEAATAAFRAGETTLTDLFETLRAALAAEGREIDARARALEAHRVLEVLVGEPLTTGGTR